MKDKSILPDLLAAVVMTFFSWLLMSASGVHWGTDSAGLIVGMSFMAVLMFAGMRRA